jgi:hypothetical protein
MNRDELNRALAHLRPRQIIGRYALRGVHRLTGFALFRGLCLTEKSVRLLAPSVDVDCRFVEPDRLRREATVAGSGLQPEEVERLLNAGEECFGVFVAGLLASHLWFSPSPAHLENRVFVHFDPAFAYSRWAFTRDDHRGKRLHALCKQKALEMYAARGRRGILSVVHMWNFPSLNAAAQVGCVRVGWMGTTPGTVWTSEGCRRLGMWLEGSPSAPPAVASHR